MACWCSRLSTRVWYSRCCRRARSRRDRAAGGRVDVVAEDRAVSRRRRVVVHGNLSRRGGDMGRRPLGPRCRTERRRSAAPPCSPGNQAGGAPRAPAIHGLACAAADDNDDRRRAGSDDRRRARARPRRSRLVTSRDSPLVQSGVSGTTADKTDHHVGRSRDGDGVDVVGQFAADAASFAYCSHRRRSCGCPSGVTVSG